MDRHTKRWKAGALALAAGAVLCAGAVWALQSELGVTCYELPLPKGLEELESKLTPEQMKLVNQFHSDLISSHCMEVETQFQYGFALGMLLMKDVYELPFPDKRMR